MKIERVGVVGGGIMGAGIAALFANQRIPVTLFDVQLEVARASLAKLKGATKLPELTTPRNAKLISPAAVDRYPELLGACDLIVEVVPEVLGLKKKVFAAIDEHRRPGSIVSSNTSGLSIAAMCEGRSDDLRAHFLGTHYFNPVRYMPLIELIPGPATRPEVVEEYAAFFRAVGKKPVVGRDTPNFIANRIGVFSMLKVIRLAKRHGISIELADAITGPPLGHPKTASFRLADMVGLDTLHHVARNSYVGCPDDAMRDELKPPPLLTRLVEAGRLGAKTGEGFYKKAGKGEVLVLNAETFEYEPLTKPRADRVRVAKGYADVAGRIRAMVSGPEGDRASRFARELVLWTGAYAVDRVGEVADDALTVDRALEWGFGRELGPIKVLDVLGAARAAEMMEEAAVPVPALLRRVVETTGRFYATDAEGRTRTYDGEAGFLTAPDDPAVLSLARLKRAGRVVRENLNARLVDLGDGALLCELDAKMVPNMNPVDDYVLSMLERGHDEVAEGRFRALVIGNQAPHFCAGANLKAVLEAAQAGELGLIRALARKLQELNLRGLHADYPVVVAPHGMTLGGGLELALGGQVRVCLSELYCGLVEVGVGLVPAGGGCLRLLQLHDARRNARGGRLGPMQNALAVFDLVGFGRVSTSAQDAVDKGLLPRDDVVVFSKDEQLRRAKEVALERLEGFQAIPPLPVTLPGPGGFRVVEDTVANMLRAGQITPHAATIARVQGRILTGGEDADPLTPVPEERVLELEREAFLELVADPLTQARMAHMLKTGKPLFN